ncbi:NAD(P)-dependent oxidoreductase [Halegenticoccus tardaugens]|uniref:NAD(P)-dependent oxidoreductase n=1 Tax=Halegenticoccus tardaugens TaxID=2071624 RepID=UPI00100AA5B7|nr:NAD(P)-dependent oxidoreductase [Halegenticoccus tardaugens]
MTTGRWRVLVTEPIDEAGLKRLEEIADVTRWDAYDDETLAREIDHYHAIVVRTKALPPEMIERAEHLRVISKHGVGLDNVPVEVASEGNVAVCNLPGVNTQKVAEHALALLLAVRKTTPPTNAALADGSWDRGDYRPRTIKGGILGLFGFGHTGRNLAELAHGIGLPCVAYDPYVRDADLPLHVTGVETKRELFDRARYVSVHAPLTDETRGAIGAEQLRRLPDDGVVVNTARGGIVDEESLLAALEAGEIAGAGMDVFVDEPLAPNHPLIERDDVVATPHIAGTTVESLRRMSIGAADNVRQVRDGRLPEMTVNAAEIEL